MGFLKKVAKWGAAALTGGASLLVDGTAKKLYEDFTGQTSAKKANERNIQLQKETNQQNIDLANTAHQREVADLKAAGLNPVLSAGGSGAATPSLGTAQVQNELPGGHMAQIAQAANIASTFSAAKQAIASAEQAKAGANLQNVQAGLQPAITQSEIMKNNATAAKEIAEMQKLTTTTTKDKAVSELYDIPVLGKVLAFGNEFFGGNSAGGTAVNATVSARNANKMSNAIKTKKK